jgi:hypothetical protein
MVTADAIARVSIDAGDQRRLSADPFPFCCSSLKVNPEADIEIVSKVSGLSLSGDEDHLDINNNNCTVVSDNDYECSSKSSTLDDQDSLVDAQIDQSLPVSHGECSKAIQHWLEQRLKHGFTIEEREAYIR